MLKRTPLSAYAAAMPVTVGRTQLGPGASSGSRTTATRRASGTARHHGSPQGEDAVKTVECRSAI
jgi:hypothetical protein